MILLDSVPGTHPAINLGCGAFCNVDYLTLLTTGLAMLVTLLIAFTVRGLLASGRPGRLQALFEMLYGYVGGEVSAQVSPKATFLVPLAGTIGLFILLSNWLEILPLDLFGLAAPTADLNVPGALAGIVIILVQVYSIRVLGLPGYLHRFTKPFDGNIGIRILMTPLNIIEEIVKPVSLSLRLFGNIFAGSVMVYLLATLLGALPLGQVGSFSIGGIVISAVATAIWKAFDVLFIGAIQAFIFMLLTIAYFSQAREGVEGEHH
ncbi:MAG: F0F1 ATP synthase subunit A [Candidatus Dormibacteraceae bacterium]